MEQVVYRLAMLREDKSMRNSSRAGWISFRRCTRPAGAFCAAAMLALAQGAQAQAPAVPVCQALTLYGNAVFEKLCKSLSPTTQNLWVCALADSPDIHTTFNVATALHITVRTQGNACQGNSNLTGNWPPGGGAGLAIAAGQPNMICGVNVQSYIPRLNAVTQMVAAPGQTLCTTPFIAAQGQGLNPAIAGSYIATCNANACP